MKRFRFYTILFVLVTFLACSDDFVPVLTTDLEKDSFEFTYEGGEKTFLLESNEKWTLSKMPYWITIKVTDAPTTRIDIPTYDKGKKTVTITVEENIEYEDRTTELRMMSESGKMVKITVTQEKKSKLFTDLESDEIVFTYEGGEKTFLLESNEKWTLSEIPYWIIMKVTDTPTTRIDIPTYDKGKKTVTITAEENLYYEDRTTELRMMLESGEMLKITVTQEKKSKLVTDLESDEIVFSYEGGEQSFLLESNEGWTNNDMPDWVSIIVKDATENSTRNTSYESGKKEVLITVLKNIENQERTAELVLTSMKGVTIKLQIVQSRMPAFSGYWILSEGYSGSGDSELAWFDIAKGEIAGKQYKERNNGKALGDTGNELAIYGGKMYVVVTGDGFTPETTKDNSYIEVINPRNGVSIKRVYFKDAQGTPAKPRNIIFEGGYGYISSYSNEVVRLDTVTLALDKHATLSGTLAEGLTYNNGDLYICNSGQGADNKISVVDIKTMKETKVITTANNPNRILTVSNGDIYFNTFWPEYKLYQLSTSDNKIAEINGISVADFAYNNNNLYTSYYDWVSYTGAIKEFNIGTGKTTKLNLNFGGAENHIGNINGSNDLFLTGMGEDVVIFDPATKEIKYEFKTGTLGGNSVVALYK